MLLNWERYNERLMFLDIPTTNPNTQPSSTRALYDTSLLNLDIAPRLLRWRAKDGQRLDWKVEWDSDLGGELKYIIAGTI